MRHKDASDNLKQNRQVSTELARSLETRRQRWERFRQYITTQSRTGFTYLLSERQFRGTLKVDHKKSALEIQVYLSNSSLLQEANSNRYNQTLQFRARLVDKPRLCQVEKSLSRQSAFCCPFGMLWDLQFDAWMNCKIPKSSCYSLLTFDSDVFMVNVNRAQSMKMIIQAARRAIGRQFIFITPQAMNDVGHGDDVKIIRYDILTTFTILCQMANVDQNARPRERPNRVESYIIYLKRKEFYFILPNTFCNFFLLKH